MRKRTPAITPNDAATKCPGTMDHACGMPRRCGWTLLETVVVGVCIIVLLALIVPSVQRARNGKRAPCLNNMKNLALATLNYTSVYDGSLPPLEDGRYGWPVAILPMLDQNALARQIRASGDARHPPKVSLNVFECPDDRDSFREPGGLSYAANAGYGDFRADRKSGAITEIGLHSLVIDRDGDGQVTEHDVLLNRATGVYWRPPALDGDTSFGWTLDAIEAADGQGQTLLLAENSNAGPWYSRRTMDLGFVIGWEVLQFEIGPTSAGPLQLKQPVKLDAYAPTGSAANLPGRSPVPSSHHGDSFHAAFCDGGARWLSDKIDPGVYARLMTPAGEQYGQTAVDPAEY